MIRTLKAQYPECPIGYSGHEVGLAPTWAAVTLGAAFVERHITLDRAMWGSDQAASVEIGGLLRLVAEHPRHRAVAGRRREAHLRERARRAQEAAPRGQRAGDPDQLIGERSPI